MKKLLLFASAVALTFSCSKQLSTEPEVAPVAKDGISFTTQFTEGDTKASLENVDGLWRNRWTGEEDQFNIAYTGNLTINNGTPANPIAGKDATDWWYGPAKYKTTTSGPTAVLTAIDNANILRFVGEKTASFRVIFPATTTIGQDAAKKLVATGLKVDDQTVVDEKDLSSMLITSVTSNIKDLSDIKKTSKESVGESLPLVLTRVNPILVIKVTGYQLLTYGSLKSITVSSETANLGYSAATLPLNEPTKAPVTVGGVTYDDANLTIAEADKTKSVKVTFTGEPAWGDDKTAFVQVAPTTFAKGDKVTVSLQFSSVNSVDYTFEPQSDWRSGKFYAVAPIELPFKDGYSISGEKGAYSLVAAHSNVDFSKLIEDGAIKLDGKAYPLDEITSFKAIQSLNSYAGLNQLTKLTSVEFADDLTTTLKAQAIQAILTANKATLAEATFTKAAALSSVLFTDFKKLAKVNAPELAAITTDAFKGCLALTNISFPKVATIGISAFEGCTALTTISKDAFKVANSIGTSAFKGCTGLTSVEFLGDDANTTAALAVDGDAFSGCTSLTTATLGNNKKILATDGKVTLGANAFENVPIATLNALNLTSVTTNTFTNKTRRIVVANYPRLDLSAASTAGMLSVYDLEEIDLSGITLTGSVANLKLGGISGVPITDFFYLAKVTLSATQLTTAANVVFTKMEELTTVMVRPTATPDAPVNYFTVATAIEANAFEGTKITGTVALPKVTAIGAGAFKDCASMTGVTMPEVTKIGVKAFEGTGITSITTGAKYDEIVADEFAGMAKLTAITFDQVATIPTANTAGMFTDCDKLTAITFKTLINTTGITGNPFGTIATKTGTAVAKYDVTLNVAKDQDATTATPMADVVNNKLVDSNGSATMQAFFTSIIVAK